MLSRNVGPGYLQNHLGTRWERHGMYRECQGMYRECQGTKLGTSGNASVGSGVRLVLFQCFAAF